jgi:acyl transferase domain-containing protein
LAYADPQSVTIGAATTALPRVSTGTNSSEYSSNDGNIRVKVSHAYGKRTRRTVRLEFSKVAPDPLISDRNIRFSSTVYIVVDQPVTGFTVAELTDQVVGLANFLTASTNSATTKLLGGEN